MKILIGTKNPGKIQAAKEAFENYFKDVEIIGMPVPSNVGDEPVNLDIYKGAKNRVNNLIEYSKVNKISADYFLGVESGITNSLGKWAIISVAVITDKNGNESFGTSPAFQVPNKYVDEIIKTDLGKVMTKIFKQNNLGDNRGGISFLTHDVLDRIELTKDAFIMALTGQLNDFWKDEK